MRPLVPIALIFLTSCDGLSTGVKTPTGLVCDHIKSAGNSLIDALAAAKPGDCIIATKGTWVGSFMLPIDVSLAASEGDDVVLKGDGSITPVLTIKGGSRSSVRNVRIDTSAGGGIAIDPGPANLVGVSISGTAKNALTASCTRDTCTGETVLEDLQLTQSATGLVISGATVHVIHGRIAEMSGTGLTDGSGVVAMAGAQLTMNAVTVEENQSVGVLIDGADTRAQLTDCVINKNRGRGVWVQRTTTGGVNISGGEASGNSLVGIGARDSSNLNITGVTVQDTKAVRVPIDLTNTEDVGDGIGLFAGVQTATLDGVVSRRNARAQILADGFGPSIQLKSPDVSGGLYRVVLQRSSATVEVAPTLVDTPGRVLTVVDSAQTVP